MNVSRRRNRWLAVMTVIAGWAALVHAGAGSDEGRQIHTNAEVVSVDAVSRTLVIRNSKGVEERIEADDNLAGFGDIAAGDRVILTLRRGTGWARVSSIVKAAPASKVAASPKPAPVDESESRAAREAFGAQVARVAGQADRVDSAWNEFRSACGFDAANPHEGARGWFVLWEGSVPADLSFGFCRNLFNQIVDLGEPVKAGMAAAEDVARRSLSPGEIRDIRRQYTLDWDGWGLTPPKRLEQ